MASDKTNTSNVDIDALTKEIKAAVISESGNATPIIVRLAWHASGTYCDKSKTGGSDGATMRYSTELGDAANAGLEVAQRILDPVAKAHPEISLADLWTLAGAKAIEFAGGPSIPHKLGRIDADSEEACPPNGRLPDATQGAEHLREVFYRMGFNDQEIVALSGAHTLGRCHKERSGFEGPWTEDPYKFDNSYFTLLLNEQWKPKQWDGPLQYEDATTGKLMMLPTDLVLVQDANFKKWVEVYAADQAKFFEDFAHAFAKLLSLGCPSGACPMASRSDGSVTKKARVQ